MNRESMESWVPYAIAFGAGYAKDRKMGREVDSFVAAALEGMWKAIKNFDASQERPFTTYARIRMKGAIQDWCRLEEEYQRRHRKLREANALRLGKTLTIPVRVPFGTEAIRRAVTMEAKVDHEERARVAKMLASLTEREKVVVLRVVLRGRTMKETGMLLGVTDSAVSYILKKALQKLREKNDA